MTQVLPFLLLLACPLGMASMMFLPKLGQLFARRTSSTEAGG